MRPYKTKVMKREGKVFRLRNMVQYMKNYGRKCRSFYKLTMTT